MDLRSVTSRRGAGPRLCYRRRAPARWLREAGRQVALFSLRLCAPLLMSRKMIGLVLAGPKDGILSAWDRFHSYFLAR